MYSYRQFLNLFYYKDLPPIHSVPPGSNLKLTCEAGKNAVFNWTRGDVLLTDKPSKYDIVSTKFDSSLTISDVQTADEGTYRCIVRFDNNDKDYITQTEIKISETGGSNIGE